MINNDIIFITIVVEDDLSLAVLGKIIQKSNRAYQISNVYGKSGCNYIDQKINGFNNAAKGSPFLVLRDLDEWECPPILVKKFLLQKKHPNLIYRIAVKEVETWLLADRIGFSKFLGIHQKEIPNDVEMVETPKEFLVKLTRKSKFKSIREDILPPEGINAKQGRGYNSRLVYFVQNKWNVKNAIENSDSLRRTFLALDKFSIK